MNNEWIETTVGEYCAFTYGKAIKKSDQKESGIPVYGSNGVYTYADAPLVNQHAVIIGRKGSVGKVHLSTAPCWVSDTAFYISKDTLEETYFVYYLLSSLGLEDMNTDAAVPGLNRNNAHRLEIKIPSSTDKKIALIEPLIRLDQKIKLNQQINQTLEDMAQALFKSWFVDFEPTKAKIAALEAGGSEEDANLAAMQAISGKTTAELEQLKTQSPENYQQLYTTAQHFPAAMQESELGEIPEGWEVSPVENILERLRVKKRYTKKQVSTDGAVPVLEQGANILLGYHDDEPSLNATVEEPVFIFGDHTCITHLSCSPFDVSQNVIPLKGSGFPTLWTYYAIQGKQEFQEYRRHWAELIVKQVMLPKEALADIYTKKVMSLIQKKEQLERENRILSSIRDELLPKLLSVELCLADLEKKKKLENTG